MEPGLELNAKCILLTDADLALISKNLFLHTQKWINGPALGGCHYGQSCQLTWIWNLFKFPEIHLQGSNCSSMYPQFIKTQLSTQEMLSNSVADQSGHSAVLACRQECSCVPNLIMGLTLFHIAPCTGSPDAWWMRIQDIFGP